MPTPDKNKAALEGLIAKANAATGGDAATVTDAVDTLIAGFGQGGGGGNDLSAYLTSMQWSFSGADFTDNPDINISLKRAVTNIRSAFEGTTGVETITLSCPESDSGVNVTSTFAGCPARVIDLSRFPIKIGGGATNMFAGTRNLTEIKGELDFSLCTGTANMFRDGGASIIQLREIRFKQGTINTLDNSYLWQANLLSDASIQSIIDGLADLTGSTAQTLRLHADVGAKLTDAQKAAASAKNWTLAY